MLSGAAALCRFSLSTSDGMLEACAAVLRDVEGALFTSHVNENNAEIDTVRGLFPDCTDYTDTYGTCGLLGPRSVLAHTVHDAPGVLITAAPAAFAASSSATPR